jgi:hypothetical protein
MTPLTSTEIQFLEIMKKNHDLTSTSYIQRKMQINFKTAKKLLGSRRLKKMIREDFEKQIRYSENIKFFAYNYLDE